MEMLKSKENSLESKKGHTYVQWLLAFLVNTTLVTYGLQAGWVSPTTKLLQSELSPTGGPLSDNEISWIASTMCLAAVAGVPLYAYINDTYGRKVGVIALSVPQALCWMFKLSSANTIVLIVARVCSGLAAGGCFNVIPVYVKEISQDDLRGILGSLLILMQNVGVLGIYALGAYFDYYTVLWIVIWLPIVTSVLMVKAPESPAFLIKTGRVEEATSTVAYLRGLDKDDKEVQKEIDSMKDEDLYCKSLPNLSLLSILKVKPWRHIFLLMSAIMTVSACNGSFAIVTYASSLLASSGVTFSPELQSLSFPVVMILAGFMSINCVERFGRKPILATTLALITMAMACIASILLIQHHGGGVPGWLPVVAMIVAVSGYAGGLSGVPYIMMSEMFNFQIRAKMLGCIVTYAWFMTFVQLIAFASISDALGQYTTFYGFAAINLLGLFITLVLIPETRGKSVEQIEAELGGKLN